MMPMYITLNRNVEHVKTQINHEILKSSNLRSLNSQEKNIPKCFSLVAGSHLFSIAFRCYLDVQNVVASFGFLLHHHFCRIYIPANAS